MPRRQQYMCPKCGHIGADYKDSPPPLCLNHRPPIPMVRSRNGVILMDAVQVQFIITDTLDVLVKCEELFVGEITIPAKSFLALSEEWCARSDALDQQMRSRMMIDPAKLN